jgi:hypothetical protein
MNVVPELIVSNGCFSGSTVLDLSKYATVLTPEHSTSTVETTVEKFETAKIGRY